MYSLPVVMGIFETTMCVVRIAETHGQKWVHNSIKALIGSLALALRYADGEMIYPALFLSVFLVIEEIVIVFINFSKGKLDYDSGKIKFIFVTTLLIILITTATALIYRGSFIRIEVK